MHMRYHELCVLLYVLTFPDIKIWFGTIREAMHSECHGGSPYPMEALLIWAKSCSSLVLLRLESSIMRETSSCWKSSVPSTAAASCRLGSRISGTTAVAPAFSRLIPWLTSWALTYVLTPGKCCKGSGRGKSEYCSSFNEGIDDRIVRK